MKEIMIKALADKKIRKAKKTHSFCIEKEIKDQLYALSKQLKVSESFLINEILRKVIL